MTKGVFFAIKNGVNCISKHKNYSIFLFFSSFRLILPVAVIGRLSRNSTSRGLYREGNRLTVPPALGSGSFWFG